MGPVVGGSPSLPDCGAAVSGTMVARDAGPSTVGLVCPEGELSPQATSHKSGRIQTAMRSLKFKGVFRHYSPVETLAGLPWCLIVLSIGPVPASAQQCLSETGRQCGNRTLRHPPIPIRRNCGENHIPQCSHPSFPRERGIHMLDSEVEGADGKLYVLDPPKRDLLTTDCQPRHPLPYDNSLPADATECRRVIPEQVDGSWQLRVVD